MHEEDIEVALEMLTEGKTLSDASGRETKTEAIATQKEHRAWTVAPGIQGLGIGERITNGEQLSDLVLKVYVAKKMPESKLTSAHKVPCRVNIGGLGEVQTDVEAIGHM